MQASKDSDELNELEEKILRGLKVSFQRLVEEERKRDGYLVFSENGKVIKVQAKDIKLDK